jgi:hypothetical protein
MAAAAPAADRRRPTLGGLPRWLRWTLLVLLVIAVGAARWVLGSGSPERIEQLLNDAIGPASGGLYTVSVEAAAVNLLGGSLRISGLELSTDPAAVEAATTQGHAPALRLAVSIDSLSIEGVRLLPLLLRRAIVARRVEVSNADLRAQLRLGKAGRWAVGVTPLAPAAARGTEASAELTVEERARQALHDVPEIRIGEIRLADAGGEIETFNDEGASVRTDRVGRMELAFTGLHIHPEVTLAEMRRFYSDDVELTLANVDLAAGLAADRVEISTGNRRARIGNLRLEPSTAADSYLERPTIREGDRIAVWAETVEATGFDPAAVLSDATLGVERLAIGSFRVDVLHDNRKPKSTPRRQPMPHDIIHALPLRLKIGALELTDGFVSYTERPVSSETPGTITFESIEGSITGIDSTSNASAPPVIAAIRTRIMGAAPAALRIEIPLRQPAPTMRVEAGISAFDATVLNRVLTPLEGLRVARGEVQGVEFDIAYEPGLAQGNIGLYYRDLDMGIADRDTGRQNLGKKVVSFLVDRFAIHGSNPARPGEAPRTGTIDATFDDTWPFFKLLWVPLRDALLAVVRK